MAEKNADKRPAQFGVYQRETGSFSAAGVRFEPGKVVETPGELAAALNPDGTPVRFFPAAEKAAEEVAKIRERQARKSKK